MANRYIWIVALTLCSILRLTQAAPPNQSEENSAKRNIGCPLATPQGNSIAVIKVLTRIADKTEAIARNRLQRGASAKEIYLLMRVETMSYKMMGSAMVISDAHRDAKILEASLDELARDAQFSSKFVDGLIYGDSDLELSKITDSTVTPELRDLQCEIRALGEDVQSLPTVFD